MENNRQITKIAKAGLELAERLYQQLWNEFGGVYIGKSVYNIGKGCRRDGKIYKEDGLFISRAIKSQYKPDSYNPLR